MKIANKVTAVIPSAARDLLFLFLLLSALPASAQVQTGTPPFGSFSGGPDVINNGNGHWVFPVLHKPGRDGFNFDYDLGYDTSAWYPVTSGGTTSWQPVYNWGWHAQTEVATGYISDTVTYQINCNFNGILYTSSNWVYHDPYGIPHKFSGSTTQQAGQSICGNAHTSFSALATDGSGFTLNASGLSGSIVTSSGEILYAPMNSNGGSGNGIDRNGNQITVSNSGVFTDTLGTTALTVAGTGTPASPVTLTYTVPSGNSTAYTVKYTAYTIQTNFGCSGVTEYGTNGATTANLVSEIDLPDWNATTNPNSKYTFTYEDTPSHSGFKTGRLTQVTLPTGGYISYTYTAGNLTGSVVGTNDPIVCADGSAAGFQRVVNDGTTSNTSVYARSRVNYPTEAKHWQTKITTPPDSANSPAVGNDTVIDFEKDSATSSTNNFYETQRVNYQGAQSSNVVLETVNTCYNVAASPCTATAVSSPITQRDVLPSIPSAGSVTLQSKHTTKYNTIGGPIELDEYAFGSGTFGALLRQTLITYASLPPNITAFRQTVIVKNGAGTVLAQTNKNYDQTTPVAAPTGTPQLVSVSGSRGNLTSIQRCTNLTNCSTYLQTTMTYDTAGQLQTVKDPLNNQTSFNYADKFDDDNGANPPAAHSPALTYPTDAYVTTVTLPTGKTLGSRYYLNSGAQSTATDQNTNSSYAHFDSFGRPLSTYGPLLPIAGSPSPGNANPWTLIQYTSPTQVDAFTDINDTSLAPLTSCPTSNSCRQSEAKVDGLGRAIHGYLISDPEGQTKVDTAYDALGRVLSSSHPYRSTSDGTYGIETPTYDALGRTTKVTHPDNTFSQTLYGATVSGTGIQIAQLCSSTTYGLGFPVVAIDEAGKKREYWSDALGRTIEADEPDSTGALTSNTCYSYDPLGNLLQIVHGSQTRTYGYDTLARVTSVSLPELANCAVTYTYDNNSNVQTRVAPAPNQTACTTKTTTTYFYDSVNRLTKITYSDGATPTGQYGFDGNSLSGCATAPPALTDSNPKGRMTSMCDGSGATSWAHDAAGRTITEKRIILGSPALTTSYSYNLDGSIATVTYPSGKVVTYTVSNAQRLTAAKDATNNIQFATAASYVAPGALSGVITGQISGGFTGIQESHNYNNSLEYTTTKATSTAGTPLDLSLTYNLVTGGDNGTVTSIANNADHGRDQTMTYDPLNRILSAKSSAASGADCWGQNFGPDGTVADDAVANLTKINNGTQTPPPCTLGSLNATVDPNNHINTDSTYAYDAAGNMTKDGSGTGWLYTFDAENRLTLATGPANGPYCYVYDGLGLRVAKKSSATSCASGTVTKLYWRSLSGDAFAETDGTGSTTNAAYTEYVFFGGRRIASRNGSGAIFYYFGDQLGSIRTITTGSGTGQTPGQLCYDADFTPYGQEVSYSARLQASACPPNYKFTGYERDPETGLDYAFARYYSSRLGRFLSTDPLGGAIGSLQSHNSYAYVVNNPLNAIDPSGMRCIGGGVGTGGNRACPDSDGPCEPECSGGGGGLDGGCLLNGAPASCSMVNGLLSNPSGATLPCPPYCVPVGGRLVDGPNGSVLTQQWAPWYVYGHVIRDQHGNIVEGSTDLAVVWHWATIATDPQIGMNIFQFGAFTQGDRLVKAGTAYTVAGIGTVVAAPVAVAAYSATGDAVLELGASPEDINAIWDIVRSVISPLSTTPPSTVGGAIVRGIIWLKMIP